MIREATIQDLASLNHLLFQVNNVHADGRPDLFQHGSKKYTDEQLIQVIQDDTRPIFVYEDHLHQILGYVFCIEQHHYENKKTHSNTSNGIATFWKYGRDGRHRAGYTSKR